MKVGKRPAGTTRAALGRQQRQPGAVDRPTGCEQEPVQRPGPVLVRAASRVTEAENTAREAAERELAAEVDPLGAGVALENAGCP
jgi:hypothetical protein